MWHRFFCVYFFFFFLLQHFNKAIKALWPRQSVIVCLKWRKKIDDFGLTFRNFCICLRFMAIHAIWHSLYPMKIKSPEILKRRQIFHFFKVHEERNRNDKENNRPQSRNNESKNQEESPKKSVFWVIICDFPTFAHFCF